MSDILKKYVEKKLVEKRNSWYYVNGESIGRDNKAVDTLIELIEKGELEDLREAGDDLEVINPALEKSNEIPKEIHDIYKSLSHDLGDIENRKKGGRFRVYIHGVDVRLENDPVVRNCPYVFRYNDKKRNVRSGNTVFNEGWTVLSKKKIEKDPRTGKPWLIVARDDTPDEDIFTVANYVLCYADKKQYKRKKGKMAMENILKSGAIADSRQEHAERIAKMSKTNPALSMEGYMSANKADQSIAREELEKNKQFTSREAQEYIDNLNSLGSQKDDIEREVENLRKLVDSGKVGKSIKNAKTLSIEDI